MRRSCGRYTTLYTLYSYTIFTILPILSWQHLDTLRAERGLELEAEQEERQQAQQWQDSQAAEELSGGNHDTDSKQCDEFGDDDLEEIAMGAGGAATRPKGLARYY
jgi:hypothetical protein